MRKIALLLFIAVSATGFGQDMDGNPPKEIEKFYFVELITNPDRPEIPKHVVDSLQREHMKNLATMFTDGQLMLAGPFEGGGGILILDIPSLEEARQLVNRDPHVQAGRLLAEIRPWYTKKGIFPLQKNTTKTND